MKETIRIWFDDFWENFVYNDNYFYNLLYFQGRYNVILDPNTPDIRFYSCFGTTHKFRNRYSKTKHVFYTGENLSPDPDADLSFTFEYEYYQGKNYRLPLWVMHINWFRVPFDMDRDQSFLIDPEWILEKPMIGVNYEHRKFCNFIYTQNKGFRTRFFSKLNSYRPVYAAGSLFNNCPKIQGRGDQYFKPIFQKEFKFSCAFENTSAIGYQTEKIFHPMMFNSIPLYWGNPTPETDFNTKSFVNYNDYKSDEEFLDKIIELDQHEDKYLEMLNEPWFVNNRFPESVEPDNVLKKLESIL